MPIKPIKPIKPIPAPERARQKPRLSARAAIAVRAISG